MFTKYHRMGGALGVADGPDSVAFSKPNEEKAFLKFPHKILPTLICYFTRGLKPSDRSTDRSTDIRQNDRSTDRQIDRSTDKITNVTLWRMRADG